MLDIFGRGVRLTTDIGVRITRRCGENGFRLPGEFTEAARNVTEREDRVAASQGMRRQRTSDTQCLHFRTVCGVQTDTDDEARETLEVP